MNSIVEKLKCFGFDKTAVGLLLKLVVSRFSFQKQCSAELRIEDQTSFLSLALVCLTEGFAEGTANQLSIEGFKIPSSDSLLSRVKLFPFPELVGLVKRVNKAMLVMAWSLRAFTKPVAIAIDKHKIPYYGKRNHPGIQPFLVRERAEKGTHWFLVFITVDVIVAGLRFTVDFEPVTRHSKKAELVKQMLSRLPKWLKVSYVACDNEFFCTDCIKTLKRMGFLFFMPVKGRKAANRKRELKKELQRLPLKEPYTMFKRDGHSRVLDSVTFTSVYMLVNGKIQGFATNRKRLAEKDIENLPDYYRVRWGIETDFRVEKGIRGKTTSREYMVKYFYFALSVLLRNVWVLANLKTSLEKLGKIPLRPLFALYTLTALVRGLLGHGRARQRGVA